MCTYFYDWLEESFSYCSFRCWIIQHLFFVSRPFCVCFFTSSFTYFLLFSFLFHLNRLIQTRKTAITFCLVYNNNNEEGEEEMWWKILTTTIYTFSSTSRIWWNFLSINEFFSMPLFCYCSLQFSGQCYLEKDVYREKLTVCCGVVSLFRFSG